MKIIYTEKADSDLKQIADYIALDNIDKAIEYVEKVRDEINLLKKFPNIGGHPKQYMLSDKSCKVLIIGNYNAVYNINEEKQSIEVRRIISSAMMHDLVEL